MTQSVFPHPLGVPDLTQDVVDALNNAVGTPSASNPFLLSSDPRNNLATTTSAGLMSADQFTFLSARMLGANNLTTIEKWSILNAFQTAFKFNQEFVVAPELLKNTVFDFISSADGFASLDGILFNGNSLTLAPSGTISVLNDCSDASTWTKRDGTSLFSLTNSTAWTSDGNASTLIQNMALAYSATPQIYGFSFTTRTRTFAPWILMDIMCGVRNPYLQVILGTNSANITAPITLPTRGTAVYSLLVNLSNLNRYANRFWMRIVNQDQDTGSGYMYIDNIREISSTGYQSSGSAVTTTTTLAQDIGSIILQTNHNLLPGVTGFSIDLSIDGGAHWKLGVPELTSLSTAVGGLLASPSSGSWNSKRQIVLRFNLSTTTSSLTPSISDYMLIYDYA